jgi:MATE family multidrug resistance protein
MSITLAESSTASRGAWALEFRATLALAWPLVLTNLAQIALTTTDILVLGRVGSQALAAATLGVNLYLALLIFATGLITATAPMIAEAIGRKRKSVRDIRRTFRQGLWSAAILSVPAWIVLWFTETIMRALGQEPQLAADAQEFMRALQWGFFPALGFVALRSFVSALERPLWTMYVTAATIVFNILANWVLVFGHLGLPAMGLRGSGLATTISNVFLFVALSLVVAWHRAFRRYAVFGRWWRLDAARLAALWRIGVPIGATMAFEITVFNAAVFVMGWFGQSSIAAHSIAIQIAAVCFMVPMGLSQAATVRVARALGAQDRGGITRAGWTAFGLTVAFNVTTSVLLLSMPSLLVGAFIAVDDPANAEVVALAISFLFCAALFQLVDGAQAVGAGMLRGLQDTRVPMIYAGLGYWGLGMPIGLLLAFKGGLAGTGVWIGLAAGLAIVAAMMMTRWARRERLGLVRV